MTATAARAGSRERGDLQPGASQCGRALIAARQLPPARKLREGVLDAPEPIGTNPVHPFGGAGEYRPREATIDPIKKAAQGVLKIRQELAALRRTIQVALA